jgi:hypothetical protein
MLVKEAYWEFIKEQLEPIASFPITFEFSVIIDNKDLRCSVHS